MGAPLLRRGGAVPAIRGRRVGELAWLVGHRRIGVLLAVAVACLAASVLVLAWTSPAIACDPPDIVDEETGELDQAAWDAGVEECARWVEEMEGSPSAADLAAQVLTGLAAVSLAVWWRPKRREMEGGSSWWAMRRHRLPRSWWVFAALGGWLLLVAVAHSV
jgi:hypothetical protein